MRPLPKFYEYHNRPEKNSWTTPAATPFRKESNTGTNERKTPSLHECLL